MKIPCWMRLRRHDWDYQFTHPSRPIHEWIVRGKCKRCGRS